VGTVLLFVLLYGLGNGMLTIVKGTTIQQKSANRRPIEPPWEDRSHRIQGHFLR